MADRVAIVTGGLRGLGRGMTLGLAAAGVRVLAVGHLAEDFEAMQGVANVRPMVADLRCAEVIQRVMDTNYVAADQMARRVVAVLVKQRWGRIINVTTKLDTRNMHGSTPYGASKAALEMATEVWAKEIAGTGVTVNIVNPGAGANTPGMKQEMRDWSRDGVKPKLVEPDEMVPPLLFVILTAADQVNGYRRG
ncbi:SDR family oxidoreductase [Rhodopila sp.]|uniref:SDR family oxidoreductase n=1 Tax=Rhodopila sp. TaxID=2480087 RepID=UPI003D0DF838